MPAQAPHSLRCEYATDRCWSENPTLEPVGLNHQVACWNLAATEGYERGVETEEQAAE